MNYLKKKNKIVHGLTLAGLSLSSFSAMSGELNLTSSVSTSYINLERTSSNVSIDEPFGIYNTRDTIELLPSLGFNYKSRYLDSSLNVNKKHIKRLNEDNESTSNFTNYVFRNSFSLFSNQLKVSSINRQTYQVRDYRFGSFSDGIADDNLSKTQTHSITSAFGKNILDLFSVNLQLSASKNAADFNISSPSEKIDSSNYNGVLTLTSPINQKVTWNINAVTNVGKRETQEDFRSDLYDARLGVQLYGNISFILEANKSDYDFNNRSRFDQNRFNNTWGYGLKLDTKKLSFSIVQNESLSDEEESEDSNIGEDSFLSYTLAWNPTQRTALSASLTERFYGTSKNVNGHWQRKKWRASISLNDAITTYSRLQSDLEAFGVYVCPSEFEITLDACFQPDSLDYQLQGSEVVANLFQPNAVLTDEVILQTNGQFSLGYQGKRYGATLNLNSNESEFLESNRYQLRESASTSINFQLGRSSNLVASYEYAEVTSDAETVPDENTHVSISYNQKLSDKITWTLNASNRELVSEVRNGFEDKRLTVSFKYDFNKKSS